MESIADFFVVSGASVSLVKVRITVPVPSRNSSDTLDGGVDRK